MDQNPQNQNNNNDLDSLLKEFQTLSAPVEEIKSEKMEATAANVTASIETPSVVTNVTPMVKTEVANSGITIANQAPSAQPQINQAPSAQPQINQAPSAQPQINQAPSAQPQINQAPSAQPQINQAPSAQPQMNQNNTINEEPAIHPSMDIKLTDGDNISVLPPVVETPNSITPTPDPNNGGKGNLIFMAIIFLIIGAFIFFIPKIDDILKQKPGAESKPTATPVATSTPKPAAKEVKTACSVDDVVTGDITTKMVYNYSSLNDKILTTKKVVTTSFANVEGENLELYNQTKLACNSLATTYAGISGYSVACEEKDKSFTITYAFDLASFTNPTSITLNGKAEIITSDVKLNDSIKEVKTNMNSLGAKCK